MPHHQSLYSSGEHSKLVAKFPNVILIIFCAGNADRHHYETFKKGAEEGMLIHLDNGKRFARVYVCA